MIAVTVIYSQLGLCSAVVLFVLTLALLRLRARQAERRSNGGTLDLNAPAAPGDLCAFGAPVDWIEPRSEDFAA